MRLSVPSEKDHSLSVQPSYPGVRPLYLWGGSLAIWALQALLSTATAQVSYAGRNSHASLLLLLLWNFEDAFIWALLTPGIYFWTRCHSFGRNNWRHPLVVHLLSSGLFSLAGTLGRLAFLPLNPTSQAVWLTDLSSQVKAMFIANLTRYFLIVAVAQMVIYYGKLREHELRSSQLEGQLSEAQLQVLKVQLEPHFLFNTLNSIAALSRRDGVAAERMSVQLAELLRISLETMELQEVPLEHEIAFLETYLDIQKARFRDRLSVTVDIDFEAREARVPHLILQPLIENSIRHGLGTHLGAGRIEVRARRHYYALELEVIDDGRGLPNGGEGPLPEGIGLSNTRARLKQLYGDDFRFFLVNASPDGGCRAHISIPFRLMTQEAVGHDIAHNDRGRRSAGTGANEIAS